MKIWALVGMGLFSTAVIAAEEAGKKVPVEEEEVQIVSAVTCSSGKDSRRIEVHTKGAGCTAKYEKFGSTSTIANAQKGVDVCLIAVDKTRKKLESAGYQCK